MSRQTASPIRPMPMQSSSRSAREIARIFVEGGGTAQTDSDLAGAARVAAEVRS